MENEMKNTVVAGHICLDIIPAFFGDAHFAPGQLIEIDKAVLATGGAVSNTGISLHKLGIPVTLLGKIGNDFFGKGIKEVLSKYGEHLAGGLIIDENTNSSYTIVISPPNTDRTFLHSPAANHTFVASDVKNEALENVRLFHFGYPSLMKSMYQNGGKESEILFRNVKNKGITTSLDMSFPDPTTEAGKLDWNLWFAQVLPYIDIFMPSIEECLFMTNKSRYNMLQSKEHDILRLINGEILRDTAEGLLNFGCAIVVLKLGERGLYIRTTDRKERLKNIGVCSPQDIELWKSRELYIPCFDVNVVGTNGSGDCTIAGFLAAFLRELPPEECIRSAVAVGACNVEAPDAVSGIKNWEDTQARIHSGWKPKSMTIPLTGWTEHGTYYSGPYDRKEA